MLQHIRRQGDASWEVKLVSANLWDDSQQGLKCGELFPDGGGKGPSWEEIFGEEANMMEIGGKNPRQDQLIQRSWGRMGKCLPFSNLTDPSLNGVYHPWCCARRKPPGMFA